MMVIDNAFEFGELVYLKTDREQLERLVTGFSVNPNGLLYRLVSGTNDSTHYAVEISKEKTIF